MKLTVPAGRYVVAVSGGVDSMVLLDLMAKLPNVRLTVAHFDHGIRSDSAKDRQLVEATAHKLHLPFVFDTGHLGPQASEATARQARYDFLHKVREAALADALVTAHHQDDMLETAVINMLRGTGRRGLSSLKSRDRLLRPLLLFDKQTIKTYAQSHHIQWREDSTNQDETYLRNYVRQHILGKFSEAQRQQLLVHLNTATELNNQLEDILTDQLDIQPAPHKLDRHWFIQLPHAVAKEVLVSWLREHQVQFDSKTIDRLLVAAKTYQPHKRADISAGYQVTVSKDYLALTRLDR
jgi:tRNA(Ile)-lysidine synthase